MNTSLLRGAILGVDRLPAEATYSIVRTLKGWKYLKTEWGEERGSQSQSSPVWGESFPCSKHRTILRQDTAATLNLKEGNQEFSSVNNHQRCLLKYGLPGSFSESLRWGLDIQIFMRWITEVILRHRAGVWSLDSQHPLSVSDNLASCGTCPEGKTMEP